MSSPDKPKEKVASVRKSSKSSGGKGRSKKKAGEEAVVEDASAETSAQAPEAGPDVPPVGPATPAVPVVEEEEEEEDDHVHKPLQSIGREETKALLDTFDQETLSRYEVFRRAHLPKSTMKKIVTGLVGPIPASVGIVVSGVGKVFVGEMVEAALEVMDERGEKGPITPAHLREAFSRYQQETGTIQNRLYTKQFFE